MPNQTHILQNSIPSILGKRPSSNNIQLGFASIICAHAKLRCFWWNCITGLPCYIFSGFLKRFLKVRITWYQGFHLLLNFQKIPYENWSRQYKLIVGPAKPICWVFWWMCQKSTMKIYECCLNVFTFPIELSWLNINPVFISNLEYELTCRDYNIRWACLDKQVV